MTLNIFITFAKCMCELLQKCILNHLIHTYGMKKCYLIIRVIDTMQSKKSAETLTIPQSYILTNKKIVSLRYANF